MSSEPREVPQTRSEELQHKSGAAVSLSLQRCYLRQRTETRSKLLTLKPEERSSPQIDFQCLEKELRT